jgi:hypothetical protein
MFNSDHKSDHDQIEHDYDIMFWQFSQYQKKIMIMIRINKCTHCRPIK